MAVNGEPLKLATHHGVRRTPKFSAQSIVTVGGTNADCSFMGQIAEVGGEVTRRQTRDDRRDERRFLVRRAKRSSGRDAWCEARGHIGAGLTCTHAPTSALHTPHKSPANLLPRTLRSPGASSLRARCVVPRPSPACSADSHPSPSDADPRRTATDGDGAQVLVFGVMLTDAEMRAAAEYLSARWAVDLIDVPPEPEPGYDPNTDTLVVGAGLPASAPVDARAPAFGGSGAAPLDGSEATPHNRNHREHPNQPKATAGGAALGGDGGDVAGPPPNRLKPRGGRDVDAGAGGAADPTALMEELAATQEKLAQIQQQLIAQQQLAAMPPGPPPAAPAAPAVPPQVPGAEPPSAAALAAMAAPPPPAADGSAPPETAAAAGGEELKKLAPEVTKAMPRAGNPAQPARPADAPAAPPPAAASPPDAHEAGENRCLGGDAFEKTSVDNWTPPRKAPFGAIQQWDDAYKGMQERLKASHIGGPKLREMIHVEVQKLRLLRHNLFCTYV